MSIGSGNLPDYQVEGNVNREITLSNYELSGLRECTGISDRATRTEVLNENL